jgi:rod shape-determining protein MreC
MAIARGSNQRLTLLILLLISITAVTLDYHGVVSRGIGHVRNGVADVISPFQRATSAVLHPVGDVFAGAIHYGQLETQNAQLRAQIGVLQRKTAQEGYSLAAAHQIETLSHLRFTNIASVVGEVISPASSNLEQTIQIDVGSSNGVGPGMPVVGPNGLIGSIISSSGSQSIVELVTDPRFGVGVLVGPTYFRAVGTNSGLSLEQLQTTSVIPHKGQVAITSGQDNGAFPPGIPVGTVTSVTRTSAGLLGSATISSSVNFSQLQYVSVLQWLSPA